ncbi:hypothetical protein MNB_SV-4-653 [hydrothermal vent metagenome]|uniref:Uncharacterized protein n=1 Tax=hydrothermal vent metagenome TaxID=652676 RepID=A0A1W1EAG6_9ZZZZ
MKKVMTAVCMTGMILGKICNASEHVNLKYYKDITIEHNHNDNDFTLMQQFMKQHPQKDVKIIENPAFNCKDTGFTQKEMYQDLVLYGTKTKDGKVVQSEKKGDFKAEHTKKYFKKTAKGEATCVEIVRYKGSELYGTKHYAILRGKR